MVEVDADKGIVRILETDIPTLSKYQRLFQFDSLVPFIFSYGFVEAYAELDGLTFSNEKIWLSYMSLLAVEKTLQEGLELYKDSLKYDSYKKELYQTYQEIQQMSVNLQEGNAIDQEQLTDFFSLLSEYRILYQKTEFFYTDLAFEKKEEFTVIKDNFKSFEQFKLDGREYLNKIFLVPDSLFNNLLRKLSDQFNLSYEDLLNYSMEEILYLFDGEKVSPDTLVERQKGYVMYVQSGRIKNITGSKALDFIDRSVSQKTFSSELKGKIANKGKVTAKAKVFKISLSDYNKLSAVIDAMEQGQVLVAETTEPSIIAACKKAAAIVTNQGGMMSHAAIVAREMNIPCVIGVTDATEIIKDGDLIEVDADNGVIRILDTEN
ncbi:MAG: PEP-utilizing enzyme, partial [Candidatus Andersenbacteria bacterium]